MKKYIAVLLLFLISCQKEEIVPIDVKQESSIFESTESIVSNGAQIKFTLDTQSTVSLNVYETLYGNLVTKESFTSVAGENTKTLYTKSLPAGRYKLVLLKGFEELNSTFIIVE